MDQKVRISMPSYLGLVQLVDVPGSPYILLVEVKKQKEVLIANLSGGGRMHGTHSETWLRETVPGFEPDQNKPQDLRFTMDAQDTKYYEQVISEINQKSEQDQAFAETGVQGFSRELPEERNDEFFRTHGVPSCFSGGDVQQFIDSSLLLGTGIRIKNKEIPNIYGTTFHSIQMTTQQLEKALTSKCFAILPTNINFSTDSTGEIVYNDIILGHNVTGNLPYILGAASTLNILCSSDINSLSRQ